MFDVVENGGHDVVGRDALIYCRSPSSSLTVWVFLGNSYSVSSTEHVCETLEFWVDVQQGHLSHMGREYITSFYQITLQVITLWQYCQLFLRQVSTRFVSSRVSLNLGIRYPVSFGGPPFQWWFHKVTLWGRCFITSTRLALNLFLLG